MRDGVLAPSSTVAGRQQYLLPIRPQVAVAGVAPPPAPGAVDVAAPAPLIAPVREARLPVELAGSAAPVVIAAVVAAFDPPLPAAPAPPPPSDEPVPEARPEERQGAEQAGDPVEQVVDAAIDLVANAAGALA